MPSYVGVTGFTQHDQVMRALQAVPERSARKFMVGVLASAKSLRGIPLKPEWQDRYPKREEIAGIFPDDPRTLNLVHYAPGEEYRETLINDLIALSEMAGPRLHGFQLNAAWPRPTTLGVYREHCGYRNDVIVLQLGRAALAEMAGDHRAVAERVREYGALIDAVLVDPSCGTGQPFDARAARALLAAVADRCPHLGLGVAGGLGPDRLDAALELATDFPRLSIDAEGRLRSPDGLNEHVVSAYLQQAYGVLDRVPYALPA
ncbi:hypothetical protein EPO33_04950 [Patescibacteria group bacterium]|nr:MAG: hypothetical protein EPO33_04950 [Patescibacteria group bacterium]